jgi:hypothetical protein
VTDTYECTRLGAGDAKREIPSFAQLRPAGKPWPPAKLVHFMQYDGETPDLVEGRRYVVAISPEGGLDAASRLGVLEDVWKLSVDGEVEFHRLARAVLRPSDGPYEITEKNAWGQVLAKALPKSHPVWQFIKVR